MRRQFVEADIGHTCASGRSRALAAAIAMILSAAVAVWTVAVGPELATFSACHRISGCCPSLARGFSNGRFRSRIRLSRLELAGSLLSWFTPIFAYGGHPLGAI